MSRTGSIEVSPVTLAAIVGVTAVAAGILVYLVTKPAPAPAPAASSFSLGPMGLGSAPPDMAATYMRTVERLLAAQ